MVRSNNSNIKLNPDIKFNSNIIYMVRIPVNGRNKHDCAKPNPKINFTNKVWIKKVECGSSYSTYDTTHTKVKPIKTIVDRSKRCNPKKERINKSKAQKYERNYIRE